MFEMKLDILINFQHLQENMFTYAQNLMRAPNRIQNSKSLNEMKEGRNGDKDTLMIPEDVIRKKKEYINNTTQ